MFNEIADDLNSKLSEKGVHLFDTFSFKVKENREFLNTYGNIAVFVVNAGTLQLLEGNRGMTVEAVLHFVFKAEEGTTTPVVMEQVLDYLVKNNNGVLTEYSNNALAKLRGEGTQVDENGNEISSGDSNSSSDSDDTFRYVMTFEMYTPVGEISAMSYEDMPDRYVMYDLPLQIIISKKLLFGDDFKIYFKIDEGKYKVLPNVVYWEETPTSMFESPTYVNEGIQKNLFVSKSWEMKGQLVLSDDEFINSIVTNAHINPETVYTIYYQIGGVMYQADVYIIISTNGTVRQFSVVEFTFKLYDNYKQSDVKLVDIQTGLD
jgi:hypothetical protein